MVKILNRQTVTYTCLTYLCLVCSEYIVRLFAVDFFYIIRMYKIKKKNVCTKVTKVCLF